MELVRVDGLKTVGSWDCGNSGVAALDGADRILLQYTALSWSRRGIPFGAVATLGVLRSRGVRCVVVFHEPSRQDKSSI